MQHLDTLWKVLGAASSVREMAQETRRYQFQVTPPLTFYLHTEAASVRVLRWSLPAIDIRAELQAGFGWRVQTDQDEAGVYLVAKRRPVVGSLARAQFSITVPDDTYLVLRLEDGALLLDNLDGTFHIPPQTPQTPLLLQSGE